LAKTNYLLEEIFARSESVTIENQKTIREKLKEYVDWSPLISPCLLVMMKA